MLKDVVIANKTYAKLNVADEQQLDNIAVKVIRQDLPEFLVPLKMLEIDGEIELRYEMSEGLRLGYLPEVMTKKEFVLLVENMIRPLVECGDWFLDYHNFYLDRNYIIVGKSYSDVKFVYIPLNEQMKTDEEVLGFLGDFILNVNLKDEPMYIMELYRRIKDRAATLHGVLEFVTKKMETNTAPATPVQEKPASQGGFFKRSEPEPVASEPKPAKSIMPSMPFMKDKAPQKVEEAPKPQPQPQPQPMPKAQPETFGQDNIQGDLINSLFGEYEDEPKKKEKAPKKVKEKPVKSSGGGLFGNIFGGSKATEEAPAPTPVSTPVFEKIMPRREEPRKAERIAPVSNSMYEEDVTIIPESEVVSSTGSKLILQLVEDGGYRFPQFVEIDMSKGYATVGRYDKNGNAQADYNFDASLSFISRRHFRIEKMGDRYSIIDLGSANGTFVNNEELIPNMPKSVGAGERIILSRNHRIAFRIC